MDEWKGIYGFKSNWSFLFVAIEIVAFLLIFEFFGLLDNRLHSVGYGLGFGLMLPWVNRKFGFK